MKSSSNTTPSPLPQRLLGSDQKRFTVNGNREWERKTLHIAVGLIAAVMTWYAQYVAAITFAIAASVGWFLSRRERKTRVPVFSWLLDRMERPYDRKNIPGKGVISMMIGAAIVASWFSQRIAVAAILTLAVGDSISHIAGHYIKRLLKKKPIKVWQGAIVGTAAATLASSLVVPWTAALAASAITLGIEVKSTSIKPILLDDNVFVPVLTAILLKISTLIPITSSFWSSFF